MKHAIVAVFVILFGCCKPAFAIAVKAHAKTGIHDSSIAVYLTIVNNSNIKYDLKGVTSNYATSATLYKNVLDKNISFHVPINKMAIPPYKTIDFKKNGLYIRLDGVAHTVKRGDALNLDLVFNNHIKSITVPVV